MKNVIMRGATLLLLCFALSGYGVAANYYWRATGTTSDYAAISNWETSPGNGISPAISPTINDDVFFLSVPTAGVNFNIGSGPSNCRDFNVTAAGAMIFTGTLAAINGNINCPNGNVTFQLNSGIQNITGAGSHFINLGVGVANRFTNGTLTFQNITNTGSYALQSPLYCTVAINLLSQSLQSNGFPISCTSLTINGTGTKTIDLSNSLVTVNTTSNGGAISFNAPNATTNYTFTNTDMVLNHTATSFNSGISLASGVLVSLDELTLNTATSSNDAVYIEARGNLVATTALTVNTMHLNAPNLALGRAGFIGTNTSPLSEGVLNIGTLEFQQPSTIANDKGFTMNLSAVIEAPLCRGQSAILCQGSNPMLLNTSTPITTTSIAYFGTVFGGSGITASASHNLGHNSGTVTWGASVPGSTFWWVGGTGDWADPTKWTVIGSGGAPQSALGCIPSLLDDVVLDAASFTGSQTVTLGASNGFCKNITWTGSNQGLLAGGRLIASTNYAGNLYVNGNASFLGARGIGANLFFVGSGNNTIASCQFAPYTCYAIRIMGMGTYTLTNAMTGTSTLAIDTYFQHTGGTFNAAGNTMDVANFCTKSLPELAGNTRVLNIANTEINIRMGTILGGRRTIDLSFLTAMNAAGSHFKLSGTTPQTYFGAYRGNPTPVYLNPCTLNDISFTATSGTPTLSIVGIAGIQNYGIVFNDVNFASNATIAGTGANASLTVNNYNLTSGHTYFFTSNTQQPYYVLSGINTLVTGCQDLVRIQSVTPGLQAKIQKAGPPFNVNGAIVADINSTAQTMNVVNGVLSGINTNVIASLGVGRTMYWVRNQGNWSDGLGHWSIGASGGDPAVNNPLGCIPRAIDDVVFDLNSFTTLNDTVKLDIDGNCRNMLWTAAAGSDIPAFAGISTQNLNVYGSLELATGMKNPYAGKIYMQGTSLVANSQSIDMNGVLGNGSLYLNGGGRYDLIDSVRIVSFSNGINHTRGDFRANGHSIYASALTIDARGPNAADISGCKVRLFDSGGGIGLNVNTAYIGRHDALGTWNAAGSTIQSDLRAVTITNNAPVTYGNIVMNVPGADADLVGTATQRVTFHNVTYLHTPPQVVDGNYMNGRFTIDTLRYPRSSFNTLQTGGGQSYTIADTLIVSGTPCNPSYIRSANVGTAASLSSTRCNFDLNFVNLREISSPTCTAAQNKSIGVDEGGNSNWTITGIPALTNLGNDTAIVCNGVPLSIGANGFGSIPGMSYAWNTGATTQAIATTTAGNFAITVTYAPGCTATDNIVVTCLAVLPIADLRLTGAAQGAVNQLDWRCTLQDRPQQFVVERSIDGEAFAAIGSVAGLAQPQGAADYRFADQAPLQGPQHYRLMLALPDGDVAYSNTILIDRPAAGLGISCHPNPTQGQVTLDVQGFGAGIYAQLYTSAGQPCATLPVVNGRQMLDLGELPSALYTLVVRDAQGNTRSVRLRVQR